LLSSAKRQSKMARLSFILAHGKVLVLRKDKGGHKWDF
jgi:hypothetical protein